MQAVTRVRALSCSLLSTMVTGIWLSFHSFVLIRDEFSIFDYCFKYIRDNRVLALNRESDGVLREDTNDVVLLVLLLEMLLVLVSKEVQ